MTKIEKMVDEELTKLVKEEPTKFIMAMLVIVGQLCVEANAAIMDLKQESTINGNIYEIKCKVTVKKINNPKNIVNATP